MAFESLADFIAMGGYKEYVWSALGISVAILVYNVMSAYGEARKLRETLKSEWEDEL